MKNKIIESYDRMASAARKWRKRNRYYHREIENLLKFLIPSDATLVEIGCGAGDLLTSLPARKKAGIDISPEMLALGRKDHPDIEFIEDDVERLKTREKYDYVLMSELVGSLVDIETAFKEVQHVIDGNGRLVIVYHNYLWMPLLWLAEKMGLKARPPLQNWVGPADMENFLYLAGFEVIRSGKRMLCPYNIPLLGWLINRLPARLPLLQMFGLIQYVVARPRPRHRADVGVSVIVPARNEKGNIEQIVERTPNFPGYSEIIFVEGHSRDGTWEEILRVAEKYRGRRNIVTTRQDGVGKGDAVRKGFGLARGELLMILDADMTVPPEELPKFYEAYVSGCGDFINGSRLVYPMEKQAMRFLNVLGNKFFAMAFSWLLSQRIKDTLCGTKVLLKSDYDRVAANRAYFGDFDPFGDFDLIFGAAKINLKLVEVPVRYKSRTYGTTQIQRFRHGWLLLQMCVFAARKLKFNP